MAERISSNENTRLRDVPHRLADLIGYNLRRASVVDLQGALSVLDAVDMRPVPLSVLISIVETPGITSAEICRTLGMKSANIVSILTDLEARGLFLRDTDAADQRIQRLFPTRHGKEAAQQWFTRLAEHEKNLLCRLDADEQAELRRLLLKIWRD